MRAGPETRASIAKTRRASSRWFHSSTVSRPRLEAQPATEVAAMHHQGDECYGGCGWGCSKRTSQFKSTPVRCAPDASPPPRGAQVCADLENGAAKPYRPKRDLQIGAPPCVDAVSSGQLLVGTSARAASPTTSATATTAGEALANARCGDCGSAGSGRSMDSPRAADVSAGSRAAAAPSRLSELPSEAGLCTPGLPAVCSGRPLSLTPRQQVPCRSTA